MSERVFFSSRCMFKEKKKRFIDVQKRNVKQNINRVCGCDRLGFLSFIFKPLEVIWYLTNYSVNIILDIELFLMAFWVAQITYLNWYAIFTVTQRFGFPFGIWVGGAGEGTRVLA